MKTYTKTETITKSRLEIRYDDTLESPREWDNLGYFISNEKNYISPDGKKNPEIQSIVEETNNNADNQAHHIELITAAINATGEKVLYITPVFRYEHTNVVYRRGTVSGFDNSNCGFYILTDKTQATVGTPPELFEEVIDGELNVYTKYANGEIYCFILYDENGDFSDSCSGFYDMDEIKERLPKEFKDECLTDYLKE